MEEGSLYGELMLLRHDTQSQVKVGAQNITRMNFLCH